MPGLAPLIALIGADGSGKSTLLDDVVAHVARTRPAQSGYLGLGSGPLGKKIGALPLIGPGLERFLEDKSKELPLQNSLPKPEQNTDTSC